MSQLISFVLADSSRLPCKERELQNEKFLPTAGIESAMSRFLDWHSNILGYFGSDCRVLKVTDIHINIDTH